MSDRIRLTEKERKMITQIIKQGWTNNEIMAMFERTTGKQVSKDVLSDIGIASKVNPGYPEIRWRTMTEEEREQVIKRIVDGEISQTQAENAYRADNGVIKNAVEEYQTRKAPDVTKAEQTTLYNQQEKDSGNALDDIIKEVETGDYAFTISVDKHGTKIICAGSDGHDNDITVEVKTKKPLKIKFVR